MKRQICQHCRWFINHYVISGSEYVNVREGVCRKHNRTQDKFSVCELWEDNGEKIEGRKRICLEQLNKMAKDISQIAKILKESYKDTKE